MSQSKELDRSAEVEEILDALLLKDVMDLVFLRISALYGPQGEGIRRRFFADVLELAGRILSREFGRELSPGEVMVVFEWVRNLLKQLCLG